MEASSIGSKNLASEQHIQLRSLLSHGRNSTERIQATSVSSHHTIPSISRVDQQSKSSREALLDEERGLNDRYTERVARTRSQSPPDVNVDLEAASSLVTLDNISGQYHNTTTESPETETTRSQHAGSSNISFHSLSHQIIASVDMTACRVTGSVSNESSMNGSITAYSRLAVPAPSSQLFESTRYYQCTQGSTRSLLLKAARGIPHHKWAHISFLFLILLQTTVLVLDSMDHHEYHRKGVFALSDPLKGLFLSDHILFL